MEPPNIWGTFFIQTSIIAKMMVKFTVETLASRWSSKGEARAIIFWEPKVGE